MSDPYISVIIPVYNRTQYVGEAINSVLNQTLSKDKYEIIVVSNVDLPEREGVKIIKSNERWLGPKIAQGIEEAKGNIISLLEDDDLFLPNKLEVVYKVFKENKELGLFKNPVKYVNDQGKEWLNAFPKEPMLISHKNLNPEVLGQALRKYELGLYNSSLSFKKENILDYLNYLKEIKLVVDNFISYFFLFTSQVIIWNQTLSVLRVSSDSASRKLANLDQYIEHMNFYQRIIYEDYIIIYKALENSNFKEFFEKYVNFQKIIAKLWSKNQNEIKLSLKDVFNAMPLYDPKFPRWKIILAYLASFMPYFLKRKLIYEKFYRKELKNLKF